MLPRRPTGCLLKVAGRGKGAGEGKTESQLEGSEVPLTYRGSWRVFLLGLGVQAVSVCLPMRKRCLRPPFQKSQAPVFRKAQICPGRVTQLARASSGYIGVAGLTPSQGTCKSQPMNALISGTTKRFLSLSLPKINLKN